MRAAFYTLGCKVNQYETEYIINQFIDNNYKIVDFKEVADLYLINTCCVTNLSESKSRKMIRQAYKRNPQAIIVVMGCYAQLKSKEIAKIKGVDIMIGTHEKGKVLSYVKLFKEEKKQITRIYKLEGVGFEKMMITHYQNKTRAFVKIQDGCDNYCSYCIIPFTRGKPRSKSKTEILTEITALVNNGYYEIVLMGINLEKYGCDLSDYSLSALINDIVKIKGLQRLRLSSLSIKAIDAKLIALLKKEKVLADHLHISLQAGSDSLLKRMNRSYTTKEYVAKIEEIRRVRPEIAITTDLIVGFPGETAMEFLETVAFVKRIKFSNIHLFPYSKRPLTKAALMPNQINGLLKRERLQILTKTKEQLEQIYLNKFLQKTVIVIIEKVYTKEAQGYSSNYLKVKLKSSKVKIGQSIAVKIIRVDYPYCIGVEQNRKMT